LSKDAGVLFVALEGVEPLEGMCANLDIARRSLLRSGLTYVIFLNVP
jgi:hypothetical protein